MLLMKIQDAHENKKYFYFISNERTERKKKPEIYIKLKNFYFFRAFYYLNFRFHVRILLFFPYVQILQWKCERNKSNNNLKHDINNANFSLAAFTL